MCAKVISNILYMLGYLQ